MSRYDAADVSEALSPETIQDEVERILASEKFARSKRLRSLLRFTVAQTLQGNGDMLKEYVIGTEVLKKPDSYDPRSDSLVRVLASRLRVKLKEYYRDGGGESQLVIEFPKGKYIPRFQRREQLQTEIERRLRARNLYSRGRYFASKLTEDALAQSVNHFREAMEAEPEWPSPAVGLANVYVLQGFLGLRRPREIWPLAKTAAEAALHLDEMSSEAHISLGMCKAFYEWRWQDADSHFLKAIERGTYSPAGHLWRAVACLAPLGRLAAARDEIGRAAELSSSPFLEDARLLILYFSQEYEAVLRHSEQSTQAGWAPQWFPWIRGAALAATGRMDEAMAVLESAQAAAPDDSRIASALGYVYGAAQQPDKARGVLARLQERRQSGGWVPNFDLALVQMALGHRSEALALLHESLREKEPSLAFLTVDPRLHNLRASPKFSALVSRLVQADPETPGAAETV